MMNSMAHADATRGRARGGLYTLVRKLESTALGRKRLARVCMDDGSRTTRAPPPRTCDADDGFDGSMHRSARSRIR